MQLQIGNTIKHLRKERDITQEQFAEILGVSCQSVSRWENNSCYPDMELLPAIVITVTCTIAAIVSSKFANKVEEKTLNRVAGVVLIVVSVLSLVLSR